MKDRLYLVEEADEEEDEEGELIYPQPGRRILALSLQGETMQVYTHPLIEGQTFESLCSFDGKLLAAVKCHDLYEGVVALCGV